MNSFHIVELLLQAHKQHFSSPESDRMNTCSSEYISFFSLYVYAKKMKNELERKRGGKNGNLD